MSHFYLRSDCYSHQDPVSTTRSSTVSVTLALVFRTPVSMFPIVGQCSLCESLLSLEEGVDALIIVKVKML